MSPAELFFWPEALLPKSPEDHDNDEPLEGLQAGYSGYIDDDFKEDDDDDLDEEDPPESCAFSVSF